MKLTALQELGSKWIEWAALSDQQRAQALKRPAMAARSDQCAAVAAIVESVRRGGDRAVRELTGRFDGVELSSLAVSKGEWLEAEASVRPQAWAAMKRAMANLNRFHQAQLPAPVDLEVAPGVRCEKKSLPIERVGLYVPAGTAPLPSTVLMLGVPARLAGCRVRVLCTPPGKDGRVDPHILAAARLVGLSKVFKVGGAQAVAAMAFGTESVPKVDKVFGPGNSWVTQAKVHVAHDPDGAACDMPAGPSEVLVVADKHANPRFVAADHLSQAEHGADSQVVFVSDCNRQMAAVAREVLRILSALPRQETVRQALGHGLFIKVNDLAAAMVVANSYAPEHLILQTANARQLAAQVRQAGSVFIGPWSPESCGDYASGTNHVLPTYGYARAYSGLSVHSFMKQITFQELSEAGLRDLGPTVEALAELEGLEAHRLAVRIRLQGLEPSA